MEALHFSSRVLLLLVCCLYTSTAWTQFSGTQPYRHEGGGLVLNEMSNGPFGTKEYVEFVVYGDPINPTAPVDISGWIIDDNNYPMSGQGNAPGHIAFGDCYTAVPPGSILVIYHADDRHPALPPDDINDTAPADGVYIIPHNAECLNACITNPNISNPLYCPCSDIDFIPQGWYLNLRNSGDVFQLRDPCETVIQALSWGGVLVTDEVVASPGHIDLGPEGQGGLFMQLTNQFSDNWFDPINYENVPVSNLETPGTPNTPENAALIEQLAIGGITNDGRISDCRDTDAGDLVLPANANTERPPIEVCLGEDLDAFSRDYSQADEMEPDAIDFTFEYTFLLTLDDAPNFTILDRSQEGDFDFSLLPIGRYRVWGFSYIQTNGSVSIEEFLVDKSTIADIEAFMSCGYDGDLGNEDANGIEVVIDIINTQSVPPPTDPLLLCGDAAGIASFDLSTQDSFLLQGLDGAVNWYADAGLTEQIENPTNYFSTTATVFALVGSSSCATEPASQDLVVTPSVDIRLLNLTNISCADTADGRAEFEFSGGMAPYTLIIDDSITSQRNTIGVVTLENLMPGIHSLRIDGADGCGSTADVAIEGADALVMELGPDQTINAGEQVLLEPMTNFTIAQWQWQPVAGLLDLSMLPTPAAPDTSTTFTLTAFDASGCSATASVTIFVIPDREIYIPSAFSPNGDGRNDTFRFFSDVAGVEVGFFRVFDRWGELVFQQENQPLADRNLAWDGTFRGQPLDPGVFIYFAELNFPDGTTTVFKGDVTLLR